MLQFARFSPVFTRLAGWPLGSYKDKKRLLRYMGDRSYISPRAQVSCPRLQMGSKCFIDDYVTIYAHKCFPIKNRYKKIPNSQEYVEILKMDKNKCPFFIFPTNS